MRNKRLKRAGLALVLLTFSSGGAAADPSVGQYRHADPDEKEVLNFYVTAVVDGIQWANADVEYQTGLNLICPPENLALTDDQVIDIVDRWLVDKGSSIADESYLAMEILFAMKHTFPCEPIVDP